MKLINLISLFLVLIIINSITVFAQKKTTLPGNQKAGTTTTLSFGVNIPNHFDKVPESLNSLKNEHPRLYMTAKSKSILKKKMTSPPYVSLLGKLIKLADKLAESGPPAYRPASEKNDEQLWQRNVGNAIPELAMAYCMTGTPKYLNAAKNYMLVSASYPTWGVDQFENSDLATAHQLYGISLGYDWLYSDLDPTSRDSIRNCLIKRGGRLFNLLITDGIYWTKSDLQNHQWVNMTGIFTAGLALYGGPVDVDPWILLPLKKFRQSIASLQPDGAGHEGIPYWGYGIEYLMKFMDLSRTLLGEDFFAGNPFFEKTAGFRLYGMIPIDYWAVFNSRIMTLGDSPRTDWYGPDYLLRKLASEYKDRNAQWLADKMDEAGYCVPQGSFLNLLWINPAIKPQSPVKLPTFRHFNDLDIVYMRSGWDGKESLTLFKCGPFIGHAAASKFTFDPGGGHTHPDVGTFQIFSHGDWLISDDGYNLKMTMYQNTLIVNGKGQTGEGRMWFNGRRLLGGVDQPRIVYTKTGNDYDYVIGNVLPVYPSGSKLTFFNRHLLYLKPDCWIVADEVAADSASLFEFYYHSDFPFVSDNNNTFTAKGTRGNLKVTILEPGNVTAEAFLQDILGIEGGKTKQMNALKVSSKDKTKDLFITVFESFPAGQNPVIKPSVISSPDGKILVLENGKMTKRFRIMTDRSDKNTPLLVDVKSLLSGKN